jgi:hypothetical protein
VSDVSKKEFEYGLEVVDNKKPDSPYSDLVRCACPNCAEVDTDGETIYPLEVEQVTKYRDYALNFAYEQYDILPHVCKNCKSVFISYKKSKHVYTQVIIGRILYLLGITGIFSGVSFLKSDHVLFGVSMFIIGLFMTVVGFIFTFDTHHEIGENFVPDFSHYYSDRELNKLLGIQEEPDEDDLQEVIDKHLQEVDVLDVLFTEQTELAKSATTDLVVPEKKKDNETVQVAIAKGNAVHQVQKFGGVHIWD